MKILTICHDHPHITDGGTEHLAYDLTRALDAEPGVSARFLAASTALSHPEAQAGSLHAMGRDMLLRVGRYDLFSMRRQDGLAWTETLARVLAATEPDIVHLHGLDRLGAEIVPLLRRLRPAVGLVLTLHDFQLICPSAGLLIRRDGGLCTRPAPDACHRCLPDISTGAHALRKARLLALLDPVDLFVAPSDDMRRRFVAWGLPEEKITVVRNGVPAIAPMPDTPRARPNRFAYFGNFAAHKGVEVLLKAAERLGRSGADLRVSLYGRHHHPSAETARHFAGALAAAAPVAQLVGPYDRSEVGRLMAGADWIVLPSLWFENAPLVLLEARRAGRPVISTGLGGMGELVRDGVDGVIVPRGDPAALAETMAALADDPEAWARFAANASQPPDPQETARQHLAHYALVTKATPHELVS
ncbi:MAG: glycosyltransferase family 4 protein [Maritimibacter sp.]|nr:glycosyltransferase family 4 protein [Maritimibacter sp.]